MQMTSALTFSTKQRTASCLAEPLRPLTFQQRFFYGSIGKQFKHNQQNTHKRSNRQRCYHTLQVLWHGPIGKSRQSFKLQIRKPFVEDLGIILKNVGGQQLNLIWHQETKLLCNSQFAFLDMFRSWHTLHPNPCDTPTTVREGTTSRGSRATLPLLRHTEDRTDGLWHPISEALIKHMKKKSSKLCCQTGSLPVWDHLNRPWSLDLYI